MNQPCYREKPGRLQPWLVWYTCERPCALAYGSTLCWCHSRILHRTIIYILLRCYSVSLIVTLKWFHYQRQRIFRSAASTLWPYNCAEVAGGGPEATRKGWHRSQRTVCGLTPSLVGKLPSEYSTPASEVKRRTKTMILRWKKIWIWSEAMVRMCVKTTSVQCRIRWRIWKCL